EEMSGGRLGCAPGRFGIKASPGPVLDRAWPTRKPAVVRAEFSNVEDSSLALYGFPSAPEFGRKLFVRFGSQGFKLQLCPRTNLRVAGSDSKSRTPLPNGLGGPAEQPRHFRIRPGSQQPVLLHGPGTEQSHRW